MDSRETSQAPVPCHPDRHHPPLRPLGLAPRYLSRQRASSFSSGQRCSTCSGRLDPAMPSASASTHSARGSMSSRFVQIHPSILCLSFRLCLFGCVVAQTWYLRVAIVVALFWGQVVCLASRRPSVPGHQLCLFHSSRMVSWPSSLYWFSAVQVLTKM